jgi:hypothetical protein
VNYFVVAQTATFRLNNSAQTVLLTGVIAIGPSCSMKSECHVHEYHLTSCMSIISTKASCKRTLFVGRKISRMYMGVFRCTCRVLSSKTPSCRRRSFEALGRDDFSHESLKMSRNFGLRAWIAPIWGLSRQQSKKSTDPKKFIWTRAQTRFRAGIQIVPFLST